MPNTIKSHHDNKSRKFYLDVCKAIGVPPEPPENTTEIERAKWGVVVMFRLFRAARPENGDKLAVEAIRSGYGYNSTIYEPLIRQALGEDDPSKLKAAG
jgi:hypothetical protein